MVEQGQVLRDATDVCKSKNINKRARWLKGTEQGEVVDVRGCWISVEMKGPNQGSARRKGRVRDRTDNGAEEKERPRK